MRRAAVALWAITIAVAAGALLLPAATGAPAGLDSYAMWREVALLAFVDATLGVVILVGLYAAVALVPSAVLGLTSDVLVAIATLTAAAVFVPIRRRVQAVVDRRFDRARYDALQVVERYGTRLRDEVDLGDLVADPRAVVASTVQPAHLAVWVSPAAPRVSVPRPAAGEVQR